MCAVVGAVGGDERPEASAVVMVFDVRELVDHHVADAVGVGKNEPVGEVERVLAGAGAPARVRGGYAESGWPYVHSLSSRSD